MFICSKSLGEDMGLSEHSTASRQSRLIGRGRREEPDQGEGVEHCATGNGLVRRLSK